MRVEGKDVVTDHDLLLDVTSDQHHNSSFTDRVLVNSQAISALSTYNLDIPLGRTGHSIAWGVLRGVNTVDVIGNEGLFFHGRDSSAQSTSYGTHKYGAGGYPTSYMGAWSRLHGDSYLSASGMFGTGIRLNDVYIDGSNLRFVFENTLASTQNLTVYGAFVVK